MKFRIQILILLAVISLELVACSTGTEDDSSTNDSPAASALTSVAATETASEATAAPEPATEPTATPEPAVDPLETPEEADESSAVSSDFYNDFEAQAFDIQLSYPDGWLVTEDPELGLFVESSEGFFGSMPDAEGAAVIILPRDELAGEDIVEALRQSVFDFGPPPDIFIEYPTVTKVGDHDVATAAFSERETGMEGFYVFIQHEGQGVFVFAASTGLAKLHFLGLMESVIGTVVLIGESAAS
ncbi:MAG: hypothetical protein WA996_21270 [Candidatus Promineifilaceae bacterium]